MVINLSDTRERIRVPRFPIDSKLQTSTEGMASPVGTTQSAAVDNLSEQFRNLTDQDFEIGGNYTVAFWIRRTSAFTNNVRCFEIGPTSGNANRLNIEIAGPSSADKLSVQLWDSSGSASNIANLADNSFFSGGTWKHGMVIVQTGNRYDFYRNNGLVASDTFPNTIGTGNRHFDECAHGLNGNFYSFAIWNTVLDSNDRTAIYNGGDGTSFNLQVDSGGYDKSANLKHWWCPGAEDSSDSAMGTDYGFATNLINIMDDAANITTADLVSDSPT